jgi:leucyl aminopeptidase (aminopeptidase T)
VHFNLGLNPRARLNEHPEFEKVRGTITMGIGDSSLLTRMWSGQELEPVVSDVHWDFIVMRPTIALDDAVICKGGVIPEFKG